LGSLSNRENEKGNGVEIADSARCCNSPVAIREFLQPLAAAAAGKERRSQKTCLVPVTQKTFVAKGCSDMKNCFFIYFIALCAALRAQPADTLRLPEIAVTDYRSKLAADHFNTQRTDSATRLAFAFSSAARLLLQLNTCFVKAYGPGNIAALSVRGSTAQQTAVLWNGVNINNPMLGQADISLLPVSLFQDISVQRGGLSALWGSGAMAGVLNLRSGGESAPLTVQAGLQYSSFNNLVQQAAVSGSIGKWRSSTRMIADLSANRYNDFSADTLRLLTQEHAASRQYGLLQDLLLQLTEKQVLGLHAWLQHAEREVPYTLQDNRDEATQSDQAFRFLADWKRQGRRYTVTGRGALFSESLSYANTTQGIESNGNFTTYVLDLEAEYFFAHRITLTAGSNNVYNRAVSGGYGGEKALSRMAAYANLEWKGKRMNAAAFGRTELFQLRNFVPTGGAAVSFRLYRQLSVRLNAGTIYRYPTLNDLYWSPGGNPQLRPEKGYSAEGAAHIEAKLKSCSASFSGSVFSRTVTDWILWLPGKNGTWSPQNITEVWSRGAETNSQFSLAKDKFAASLLVATNYVLSTRTRAVLLNDESVGRQLPYVPMYTGAAVLSLAFRKISLRLSYGYTGYRYLSADNYNYLSPYSVADARAAYTFSLRRATLSVFAEADNLFNEIYFSVAQYPMPLRNYKAGIQFQYQKSKTRT
jgi:vitamin B12 transporter